MFLLSKNGGAAAADPSRNGQRWKKKMEAVNLRAARETFRERNPLVRVGYTNDGVSVLKVIDSLMFLFSFFPRIPPACCIPAWGGGAYVASLLC